MEKSIVKVLKEEHQQVLELIKRICSESNVKETARIRFFSELKEVLRRHSAVEAKILYPALHKIDDLKLIATEAQEQHEIIETLLAELEVANKDSSTWMARFQVFRDHVEHHIEKEEEEIFEVMGQYFLFEELCVMAGQYEEELGRLSEGTEGQRSAKEMRDLIKRSSLGL